MFAECLFPGVVGKAGVREKEIGFLTEGWREMGLGPWGDMLTREVSHKQGWGGVGRLAKFGCAV